MKLKETHKTNLKWILVILTAAIWYNLYQVAVPIGQAFMATPVKTIHITKQAKASELLPSSEPTERRYKVIIPNKNSLAFKNNNPGNLRFANQKNAIQGHGGFAKFRTVEDGFQGLIRQIVLDQTRDLQLNIHL
jgi:hypothetical protein